MAKKKQEPSKDREEVLKDLRGGAAGVKRWNARTAADRETAGPFREVDLTGAKLAKADLSNLDFQKAVFDGADLRAAVGTNADFRKASFKNARLDKAVLYGSQLAGASFEGASLVKADLSSISNWKRVSCQGTNLSGADLSSGNFVGADLSGAELKDAKFHHATFDENTRFPDGFTIPAELVWKGKGLDPRQEPVVAESLGGGKKIGFTEMMDQLREKVDKPKLSKALAMLKAERFSLYSTEEKDHLVGVVKSQTSSDLVYACRINSDGSFSCCTQNLNQCGGLRGSVCKHLLVLIVGLGRGETFDRATVLDWVESSRKQRQVFDSEQMSAVFLRYKGAEAGEIDWRPSETIPEDYYAL